MHLAHDLLALAQTRRMRWLLLLALVLLYMGWIGYVVSRDKPLDFYVYYIAAYGFAKGEDIYSAIGPVGKLVWDRLAAELGITNYTLPYRYPPLAALLVWPLTFLPFQWAGLVWSIAGGGAFIGSAWLMGKTSRASWGVNLAMALLLFFVPPLTTMHAGQVNGFVLLALALPLYAFAQRRPAWMGIGAATGALLKLVPLAHLAYLGWRRQWRAALIGLLALVLLFCLTIPLIRWQGVQAYAHNFFALGEAGNVFPGGSSQSLTSFFGRFLSPQGQDGRLTGNPQLAQQLGLIVSLALALATVVLCWPTGKLDNLFALEYALVTVTVNLITPFVWYHQLALLLLPFFVLAERALTIPSLRWVLVPLAIGYVAIDIHGLAWHSLDPYPMLASTPFYATMTLWVSLAWLIIQSKRAQTSA